MLGLCRSACSENSCCQRRRHKTRGTSVMPLSDPPITLQVVQPQLAAMQPDPIDITFDFRRDTPAGGDPDALSPTLRRYHRLLWSKQLPDGSLFELDDTDPVAYLRHRSPRGDFLLSSDSVIPSFRK